MQSVEDSMYMRTIIVAVALVTGSAFSISTYCAESGTAAAAPLVLVKSIDLPGINGDFDHFTVDVKGNRLFLAAEEHHTVEVFDLQTGATVHSIGGLDTPHSILYAADRNRIFVVDGGKGGSCEVFN